MTRDIITKRAQLRQRIKRILRARKIILTTLQGDSRFQELPGFQALVIYDYLGSRKLRKTIADAKQAIRESDTNGITYYNDLLSKVRICMHVTFPE